MTAPENPEAAFLAMMTASATHELRNVLAIVKESAGLVEDIVHAFDRKGTLDPEKVHRTVDRIRVQVDRGADLLTNLNRLAHTTDHDAGTLDLRQEVEQVAYLSRRFARRSGQEIAVELDEEEVPVSVHPLHLQMLLFHAIESCMDRCPEGTTITLRASAFPGGSGVEFGGEGAADVTESASWPAMTALARSMQAEVGVREDGGGGRVLFSGSPSP